MDIAKIEEEFKGMAVIVTGGNKGIGYGIAKAFCTYGARVTIAARDAESGKIAAETLNRETAGECRFATCDVANEAEVKAMVEEAAAVYGRLDCLVNNAGFNPARSPIDRLGMADLDRVLRVNLGGIFLCTKYALPYLRASRGSIINISSVLGHSGQEGNSIYAASKGGIIAFTKSIACDEARRGVRVNVLNPGDIHTDINHTDDGNAAYRLDWPEGTRIHHLSRRGEPEDVGTACLFLASSWASFITGSELFVDGGFFAGHGLKLPRYDWGDAISVKPL